MITTAWKDRKEGKKHQEKRSGEVRAVGGVRRE